MPYQPFKIPPDLLLGSATAATHIEGGELNHNWYRWSEEGKIKDGSHCKVACDHVNRIETDVELLKTLNSKTYRMGLEWARIEPEEGKFSEKGIALYRKEIELLLENNIQPLVTLWHFSNPLWMEDDGAWVSKKSVERYVRFVDFVTDRLGDLVTDWITVNEPNVYLYFAYFEGSWPPGSQGQIGDFLNGATNLIHAHIRAFQLIHKKISGARVGAAHHLRVFDPVDSRPLTKLATFLNKRMFQQLFLEPMTQGKFLFPIASRGVEKGQYADFLGINYYTHDMVKGVWNPGTLFGELSVNEGSPTNDLGWEIYPEGLFRLTKEMYERYQLPIYITENGTCDAYDRFRSWFIYDHLAELVRAKESGVDIQRYYHWSLLDNFEWAEGNSARFGLYHTNYETQERTIRKSGEFYARICREYEISPDLIEKYL